MWRCRFLYAAAVCVLCLASVFCWCALLFHQLISQNNHATVSPLKAAQKQVSAHELAFPIVVATGTIAVSQYLFRHLRAYMNTPGTQLSEKVLLVISSCWLFRCIKLVKLYLVSIMQHLLFRSPPISFNYSFQCGSSPHLFTAKPRVSLGQLNKIPPVPSAIEPAHVEEERRNLANHLP